jgi:hypothetical protein
MTMPIQVNERDGDVMVEVLGVFCAEDANLIETAVGQMPSRPRVEVDLRRAREKHLLALWLLAQAARRDPGRYRLTGLTMEDSRFLAMVGAEQPGALAH